MVPSRSRSVIDPGVTAVITPRSSGSRSRSARGRRMTSARIILGPKNRSIIARGSDEPWASQKKVFSATRARARIGSACASCPHDRPPGRRSRKGCVKRERRRAGWGLRRRRRRLVLGDLRRRGRLDLRERRAGLGADVDRHLVAGLQVGELVTVGTSPASAGKMVESPTVKVCVRGAGRAAGAAPACCRRGRPSRRSTSPSMQPCRGTGTRACPAG